MPFPTFAEKSGSLSATGLAKEATFGTPVAATTWLPMTENTMEEDPGWFSPEVMMATRDLHVFNMQGEAKFSGAVGGPLFPSNAMALLVASIGQDAAAGYGVTGSAGSGSTTLSSGSTAGATTISVASATGFSTNQVIQVDTNNTVTPTTSECRKITNISGTTLTLDTALVYAHASSAPVVGVVAPYTHTINQENTLPSLTVEKVVGDFQSLQFAGCRVGKLDIKAPVGNSPVEVTADLSGQSVTTLSTPTAVAVTNEEPFVFSEATLSVFGGSRTDVTNVGITVDNGLKETYTYSGSHGPSFITPVTLHVNGTIDVVWDSFTDATYGDFNRMANQTLGALTWTVQHPSSGGTVTINLPQIVLSKFANDVKMTDVIMSSLNYEATKSLSSGYTIQATVVNSVYVAY